MGVRGWAIGLAGLVIAVHAQAVQWYEYYERGVQEAEAGNCQEAIRHLQRALRTEPNPRARIRTYGSNFLVSYDPHFHLARCYAVLGDFESAERHLRVSQTAGVTPAAEVERVAGFLAQRRAEAATPQPTPKPTLSLPATPASAPVWVGSVPEGSTVLLDGRPIGRTPLGPQPLSLGNHRLRLEHPGFWPHEEDFVLGVEGARFRVTLQPLPTPTPTLGGVAISGKRGETPPAPPPAVSSPFAEGKTKMAVPTVRVPTPLPATLPVATSPAGGAFLATPGPEAGGIPKAEAQRWHNGWLWIALLAVGAGLALVFFVARKKHGRSPSGASLQKTIRIGGEVIAGKYSIVGMLGSGGMGTTFQGVRLTDNVPVAIKIPHDHLLAEGDALQRFLREARLGAQLHHPRIVSIFDTGEHHGKPYIVMELLQGETLKACLRRQGALPLGMALKIATEVAEAIDYAHSKGVVHRDLKPENIMLLTDGNLKVLDFGLARIAQEPGLTQTSVFLGTPIYAAPELVERPSSVDGRVDIYALGIILFEMLEGRPPYSAGTVTEMLEKHLRAPFPSASELPRPLPLVVYQLVAKACAKKVEERWPSAEAFLVKILEIRNILPEAADTSGPFI